MRQIYNQELLSPTTPEQPREDLLHCLAACANQKFSLTNLLPSRLALANKMCVTLIPLGTALILVD
jgi:hypothetical protein